MGCIPVSYSLRFVGNIHKIIKFLCMYFELTWRIKMAAISFHALGAYVGGTCVTKEFDLDEYSDYYDFAEARENWLESIGEEEWIVCDYEGVPSQYVSEYDLDPAFFDFRAVVEEMGNDEELVEAGLDCDVPLDKIAEAYCGKYRSLEDYAYDFLVEVYDLDSLPPYHLSH